MNGADAGGAATGDDVDPHPARVLWQHVEPLHAVVYFDDRVAAAVAATGIEGWWAGYVAGRAAPLGRVPPEVVEALFFGFAPGRIGRGVPGAWDCVDPADLVVLRRRAVGEALADLLGGSSSDAGRVAELLGSATRACGAAGRALYAAHAATTAPTDPMELVWHRCTLLREHRGDGHVAACVTASLDGIEVHHLAVARGAVPGGDAQRRNRGWSPEEWSAAVDRLRRRGLLDREGTLSAAGEELVGSVERMTDDLASAPVEALGADGLAELVELMGPWVDRLEVAGTVQHPNAMGLTPRR